ncbi:hypothetical protein [Lapillicoccus sp.]|uniref:hypothetical protein n=1 Tax=Lapillicoccus sp. TaxID=1909287 RepID=UPI0025F3B321|nr:hypothetical protein [Lapillicoccus sp.]
MTRSPAARRGSRPDPPPPAPIVPARRLLTVTGASGGLGASVLSVGVAVRAAAAGVRVAAVDLDPFGGGLDVTFGAEQTVGLRWSDLSGLDGAADGSALWDALPETEGARVLSHSREVVHQPVAFDRVGPVVAALRAACDLVVVDLPLRGDGAQEIVAVADTVVVLAGARLRQVAALTVVAPWLRAAVCTGGDLVVCLRSVRDDDDVRGVVTTQLGLPVLGVLADDRGLDGDLVHGIPPGTRRGAVTSLADLVVARAMLDRRREQEGAA